MDIGILIVFLIMINFITYCILEISMTFEPIIFRNSTNLFFVHIFGAMIATAVAFIMWEDSKARMRRT
jgi:hypothetical protein